MESQRNEPSRAHFGLFPQTPRGRWAAGLLGVGVALFAATVGGSSASVESPQKHAIETAEAIRQSTAEAGPHAPKPPVVSAVPTRASCPVDNSAVQTKITGPIYQPPPGSASIFNQITVLSEATAVGADGRPYSLYFGTLRSDNTQWVIVRWRGAKDPCVEGRTAYEPEMYPLPLKSQAVTLTRIDGNSLSFQTPDGRSGNFNYTTGTFSTATPRLLRCRPVNQDSRSRVIARVAS
jgi:hypothetical protein